ncbi:MAG TPA: hypothetical protein VGN26_10520 [Armatimonadota bacterium]|jgi:hypothetical protein
MRAETHTDRRATVVAWQGISLSVPEDWSFAAFGGDWSKGSFRVDAPLDAFVEVEWSPAGASPNLKKEFEASVARMRQKSKRSRGAVEVKEKPRALSGLRLAGGVPHTFSLRADSLGYGALWHSVSGGRMLLAKVVGPQKESLGPLAHGILSSIEDHAGDDLVEWSIYGFSFRAPRSLRLAKQSLQSGHLAMELSAMRPSRLAFLPFRLPGLNLADTEVVDRKRGLQVDRWSLADVILKKDGFQHWVMGALWPRLKSYDYKRLASSQGDHEAAELRGRKSGIPAMLKRLPFWLVRRDPRDHLQGHAWVCPESNRIFSVLATGGQEESRTLAAQVVTSVECH